LAAKGRRSVDFTFRSDYRDDHAVERSAQPIHTMLGQARTTQKWINRAHIVGMHTLQASRTRTREWLSIESPDAIVLLESGAHDEWLDPYRNWARDNGVTVLSHRG
jgi:hypothetical protein